MKRKSRIRITAAIAAAAVLAVAAAFAVYVNIYYHADDKALLAASGSGNGISVTETEDGNIVFSPQNEAETGIVFYPGGKVQQEAYAPLMRKLADEGFICVLVKMPMRLAIFDVEAADKVISENPELDWYICGHSLGGAAAAMYAAENADRLSGIIFLAAYSAEDLSDSGLEAVSVMGSEDGVLDRDAYRENLRNMPDDFTETVIDGGCHAGFGNYGKQKGDGTPRINSEKQQKETAEAISNALEKN